MFFLLEWNIRNQRHDKSLSVYTHFLLTLRAPYNWARIWQRYRGAHWKLYLSASNNMNYYNFTKQTTHKCVYYSQGPTQTKRYDMEKKFLIISPICVYLIACLRPRKRYDSTLYWVIISVRSFLCVYVCLHPEKQISIFDAISLERYLLILSFVIITWMHASTKRSVEETQRTKR